MAPLKKTSDKEVEELLNKKLSLTAFAKVVGAQPQFITRAQNDGVLILPDDGYFVFGPALRAWQQWKDRSKSNVRAEDDSKIRKLRIQEMELEQAERSAELVPFMLIKEYIMEKIGKLNGDYQSLPARVTRDMALRKEIQKQITLIHKRFESNLKGH